MSAGNGGVELRVVADQTSRCQRRGKTLLPEAPYLHGSFCWADVATPDVAGAKAFYTALFGWTFDDQQMAGGTYSICMLDGGAVAGLYPASAERAGTPCWFAYVAVDEVELTVADIEVLSGRVLTQPTELPAPDAWRSAPILRERCSAYGRGTPAARVRASRPASRHRLLERTGSRRHRRVRPLLPGCSAGSPAAPSGEPHFYVEFVRDGCLLAGRCRSPRSARPSLHWLVYFAVADCDAAAATAQAQGGYLPAAVRRRRRSAGSPSSAIRRGRCSRSSRWRPPTDGGSHARSAWPRPTTLALIGAMLVEAEAASSRFCWKASSPTSRPHNAAAMARDEEGPFSYPQTLGSRQVGAHRPASYDLSRRVRHLPRRSAERHLLAITVGSILDGDSHVAALAIVPEFRRRGLGGLLLAEAFEQTRAAAFPRTTLHVWAGNSSALALYCAWGSSRR